MNVEKSLYSEMINKKFYLKIILLIIYKANFSNKKVIEINGYYLSSQICSDYIKLVLS